MAGSARMTCDTVPRTRPPCRCGPVLHGLVKADAQAPAGTRRPRSLVPIHRDHQRLQRLSAAASRRSKGKSPDTLSSAAAKRTEQSLHAITSKFKFRCRSWRRSPQGAALGPSPERKRLPSRGAGAKRLRGVTAPMASRRVPACAEGASAPPPLCGGTPLRHASRATSPQGEALGCVA